LLSPVNPKTDAEKCDRIRIGGTLWLEDDESRAGLSLKPKCLAEEERADIDFPGTQPLEPATNSGHCERGRTCRVETTGAKQT
jgi:hypothetical protein